MELFFFDIETAGNYPDFETFKSNDSKGSELFTKKWQKLWKDKTIEEAYIDYSGIISTYGKIVCISYGFLDGDKKFIRTISDESEEEIIKKFNSVLEKVQKKNFNLSGFRILHFDIVWFLHKCHKWRIKPADIIYIYGKKPWDLRVVDMSEDWKGKFAISSSFDEMIYELGLESPKQLMNGSDVHKKYWEGKLSEILEYCEKDVESCIDSYKLLYWDKY